MNLVFWHLHFFISSLDSQNALHTRVSGLFFYTRMSSEKIHLWYLVQLSSIGVIELNREAKENSGTCKLQRHRLLICRPLST